MGVDGDTVRLVLIILPALEGVWKRCLSRKHKVVKAQVPWCLCLVAALREVSLFCLPVAGLHATGDDEHEKRSNVNAENGEREH
jgi:hypothetical protein